MTIAKVIKLIQHICHFERCEKSVVHRAFDFAKTAGIKVIIGVPEHNLLDLVKKKVQEYDTKLAIHNHGPCDERYPSPQSDYEKIKNVDPREWDYVLILYTGCVLVSIQLKIQQSFFMILKRECSQFESLIG